MSKEKLFLIYKNRMNARGVEFHSLKIMSLERLRNYSSVIENSKTIKSAISKLNKDSSDKHSNTYRMFCFYTKIGVAKGLDNKDLSELSLDITENNLRDFFKSVKDSWGLDLTEKDLVDSNKEYFIKLEGK